MNTPIVDFVRRYAEGDPLRLHMPGHKGHPLLGLEHLDITEVPGADSLYEADGIIAQSEINASTLFGCPTFYSTEGSSQCIRAMVYLAMLWAKEHQIPFRVAAGRNAHKTFPSAAALLDADVVWLTPRNNASYLSCVIEADELDAFLRETPVSAVYLTSPDYLGNVTDIAAISAVCKRYGCLLLVDNAHGAYLRFLQPSLHPMDLGADLCCDSAHKTLPVLTGGAYLHTTEAFAANAKSALSLFGSTSPSYLILQSLDAANAYLSDYQPQAICGELASLKTRLAGDGWTLVGNEPMKLTLAPKMRGWRGTELAQNLRNSGIECEFADPDLIVFMITPETGTEGLSRLEKALSSVPLRDPITEAPPAMTPGRSVRTIREAMLSPAEILPASQCLGRVLAAATVGCPPAVPIVASGEIINETALQAFAYYGIDTCAVIK